jgi:PAS domain S-box-containing protein
VVQKPRLRALDASTAVPLGMLGQLFDATLDAVVVMDGAGRILAWNGRAETTFGWSAADAVGRRLSDLVIPAHYRAGHEAGLRHLRATGEGPILDTRLEIEALHRDGHEFPVELTVTQLPAQGDGEPSFAGFVRDLSREREAEAARTEAETRYRSLVERLPGVAYIAEIGGAIRFISPRIEAILGYRPDEWTFERWRERLNPRDRNVALATLRDGEASGEPFMSTYRLKARDGHWVWVRDEGVAIAEADGGRSVHGVMFDVTRERGVEMALRDSRRERTQIAKSLQRLQPKATAEETAAAICSELPRIRHLDVAGIVSFERHGAVVPLAMVAPPGAPLAIGHPLPVERAAYLRESATGPWVDEWVGRPGDGEYKRQWLEAGLTTSAFVPFGANGEVFGLLIAGTTARVGVDIVTGWLPALAEYAAIGAALLGPELAQRRAQADVSEPIRRAINERAFTPSFQPVVELESRSVVGYEALTRFHDGTLPERRFAAAEAAGLGRELELATLAAAIEAAHSLPPGRWLSLNVSPSIIGDPATAPLFARLDGRPLVLELTERSEIHDYEVVREAFDRLPVPTSLAVDDAGAGFASLRHIIELHPRYVKLDMRLVRGVDSDPARQALIAGMVYFSRQTDCVLVAEGIETEDERRTLRLLGVTFGQGFLLGRPEPAPEPALSPGVRGG